MAGAREILQRYPWPGNIRELGNVANHISLMVEDRVLPEHLPHYLLGQGASFVREEALLAGRCGLERARAVLELLADFADGSRKAGRKSLGEALRREGRGLVRGRGARRAGGPGRGGPGGVPGVAARGAGSRREGPSS